MFRRVLIAWDGSRRALLAFDVAIEIARRFDADLVALSVAYSPANAETGADRIETVEAARLYLIETFNGVRDRADRVGLVVEHVVVSNEHPADAIRNFARDHGADLIVCGHHPAGFGGRLLLRGLAQDLIRTPDTPVLVVGGVDRR